MDIWGWVSATKKQLREGGNERLASLMSALPTMVCDNEHARVEALVPEALALARAAKQPWVEVFIRHWLLQSRVFHRHEVGRSRREAVSLLEFANREETEGCPQSICVTQDLAGCYARVDGPGYVSERLQVARETLSKIDPSWPCYACISSEYADALIDGGEEEEALRFIRAQVAEAAASGEFLQEEFALSEAHALILLGRFADAVTRLENHHHPAGGDSHAMETRLMRAWALVGLKRYSEAATVRPAFTAIVETADHYESWLQATLGLVRGGKVDNNVTLGRQLRELYRRLEDNGAIWGATQIAIAALELARERGANQIAALIESDAERLAAGLRSAPVIPMGPVKALPSSEVPAVGAPGEAEAICAALPDDPEMALERLGAARERWPEDPRLASVWAQALRAAGFAEQGLRELEVFAAAHPADGETLLELCRLYLACGDPAAIASLVRQRLAAFPELYPTGLWLLAQAEEAGGSIESAISTLKALIELVPDADPALSRLADLLREQRRYPEALAIRRRLVERLPPGAHDWDLMSEATVVGDWALVRRSAERLGIPAKPAGEGPIDGSYGLCRIRFDGDVERAKTTLWAERRGPVTARIVEIVGPGSPERFDDLLVFDAAMLNAADEQGDEGDDSDDSASRRHPVFRAMEILERADMVSFSLDGPHPGEAVLERLRDLFTEYGGRLWVCSGDNYRLRDRESDDQSASLLGFYAYIAFPASVSLAEVDAQLTRVCVEANSSLAWIELAEALDPGPARDQALRYHRGLVRRFGL
ncbi:MAG TPA: hypothetical protein ENJ18_02300 [Nannocystis exedens]|nr:hypothetical protein [Nannocystis exedens]